MNGTQCAREDAPVEGPTRRISFNENRTMTRIAELELITHIADLGSLTAAAKALDWSPAAASAALRAAWS